jgi:DHA1 family bicyclomycin/chloramphenicol resistance-like MFS transporter
MLVNARIVGRFGTRPLAHVTLICYLVAALLLTGLALVSGGRPPLLVFLVGLGAMLFAHGLLIPNFTTIALHPMGAVAGTASSVLGAIQLGVGSLLGWLLDRTFDGSVLPLSLGFLGYGVVALVLVLVAERGQLFQRIIGAEDVTARSPR